MHFKFEKNGMLVGHKILFVEIFQNIPELMNFNQRIPKLNSVPNLIAEYLFNGMIVFFLSTLYYKSPGLSHTILGGVKRIIKIQFQKYFKIELTTSIKEGSLQNRVLIYIL